MKTATTAKNLLINFNPNGKTFAAGLGIEDQRATDIENNVKSLFDQGAGPDTTQKVIETYTEANELCYAFFVVGEQVEDPNSMFSGFTAGEDTDDSTPSSDDDNEDLD